MFNPPGMKRLLRALACGLSIFGMLAASALAEETLNVRYTWKLKGEYAPFYVAQEMGYFSREGLAVRLGEGAGAPAALGALLQGQEDAVVLPAIFALTAISKGMPIKVIALYHPRTPVGIISWPDKPIRTPKDLEGKTVASSVGDTAGEYLDFFCTQNKIDCGKVKRINVDAQARAALFMQHKVDAMGVYSNANLPVLQEKAREGGASLVLLELDKNGLVLPGLSIVSSDSIIARKPQALRKLLKAVGDGVAAMKHKPDEAAAMLMKNWSGHPSESIVRVQVKVTADAVPAYAGHPIGWVDAKSIGDALAMLKSTGEVSAAKPAGSYFTNELLSAKK